MAPAGAGKSSAPGAGSSGAADRGGGVSSREQRVSGFGRYEELRLRRLHQAGAAGCAQAVQADWLSFSVIARELRALKPARPLCGAPGAPFASSNSRPPSKLANLNAMRALVPPLSDPAGVDLVVARGALSREVNKRVRRKLLRQHLLSNRFHGSAVADEAEAEYQRFVSQYHRSAVARRLLQLALLLGVGTIYDTALAARPIGFVALRTILPVGLLSAGGLGCAAPATRRLWRLVVICAAVGAHGSILAADALLPDVGLWSACAKDYATIWQLLWVLLAMGCTALFLGLDVSHAAWALSLQWLTFVTGAVALHADWWHEAGQGAWRWPSPRLPAESAAANATAPDTSAAVGSSRMIVDCLLSATCALLLLLLGVRQRSRAERQIFVNCFVMHAHVSKQERCQAPPSPPTWPRTLPAPIQPRAQPHRGGPPSPTPQPHCYTTGGMRSAPPPTLAWRMG